MLVRRTVAGIILFIVVFGLVVGFMIRTKPQMTDNHDSKLSDLAQHVGTPITVEGLACDAKAGAAITGKVPIYIEGLEEWPVGLINRRVRASGILVERTDVPPPMKLNLDNETVVGSGAPGPLYTLRDARYEVIRE